MIIDFYDKADFQTEEKNVSYIEIYNNKTIINKKIIYKKFNVSFYPLKTNKRKIETWKSKPQEQRYYETFGEHRTSMNILNFYCDESFYIRIAYK